MTQSSAGLQQFKNQVGIKFQLYNSLFGSLPFHRIEKTGILVSLLLVNCEEGYNKGKSPVEIIDEFFAKQTTYVKEEEKADLLFRVVQYIERQVVLFDALEDAAFTQVHDMGGKGTMKQLDVLVEQNHAEKMLSEKLKDFNIQLVLTAHPTQFYRGAVLGIIHDISSAVDSNNEEHIYTYLQQLGRTPFFQQEKPTPYDEALSLLWYLENIFYHATGNIINNLKNSYPGMVCSDNPVIKMGFWPGGDRDGNPFVKAATTLQVAQALRSSIIRCYYRDARKLKRRLTFKGVDVLMAGLEKTLNHHLFNPDDENPLTKEAILSVLNEIRTQIIYQHNSLFVELVDSFIAKVEVFGMHFASLDVRQDSRIHVKVIDIIANQSNALPQGYTSLSAPEKIRALTKATEVVNETIFTDDVHQDTLRVIRAIKDIQKLNGEAGCNRYIISQCSSALNVMEVFGLFLMAGWKTEELTIDIMPLFETVDDLHNAAEVMKELYEHPVYSQHLLRRGKKQSIMVGFSDGTKDGGYLMANWGIYKAKEELTAISKEYDIDVVFFDGRGGPPARGGGKTHQFYASMGKKIANKEIQLTIQGQTVSSNFGTIDTAQYNMEQLLHAGLSNDILTNDEAIILPQEKILIDTLAEKSFKAYIALKEHPYFADYLSHASALRFYAQTNIGSRPAKRGAGSKLSLKDLRAIPFVGAWSQLKQNVTGYYGVGTAFQQIETEGKWDELVHLYQHSLFFKTLIDNCEMAMQKCFFPLTAFLKSHPVYGEIWNMVHDEYELTKKYVLKLSGHAELMDGYPIDQLSVQMRERIVLPLITIQQYAITQVRHLEEGLVTNAPIKATYEKLAMRCSFGIINAGRNSA
ncbi:phosphoenolpyruvate carboxylase [Parasediminibacterium sp. JCM 36343]|uniref:phosphoenolpyruvate carboxylase n=1 Tax=Parasediminibacterium sp. JCM 36343 TaxID=3374279 RepID=UPI003978A932